MGPDLIDIINFNVDLAEPVLVWTGLSLRKAVYLSLISLTFHSIWSLMVKTQTIFFPILMLKNRFLGSSEVPHKIWARSVQTLDIIGQTNKQTIR